MKKLIPYFFILIIGFLIGYLYIFFKPCITYAIKFSAPDEQFCSNSRGIKNEVIYLGNSNTIAMTNLKASHFQAIVDSLDRQFGQKESFIEITKTANNAEDSTLLGLKEIILKKKLRCIESIDSALQENQITISIVW